ncbi:MAG: PilT/PilU family type 4a pilus ATPase [Parcubacteria group bacterium]|nr:PilT/PilU family type 4a pilus ATPase [Parcubacteria group bacterium]
MSDIKHELEELILTVIREDASDLHLSTGRVPHIRVMGDLVPLVKKAPFTGEEMLGLVSLMLTEDRKEKLFKEFEVDFSYSYGAKARFRGNAFFQRGVISVALRLIPEYVRNIQELQLPPILETFARKKQGFFLVVGPIGQGKSTTLAALIQLINQERAEHILTVEDPVEYVYKPAKSIIDQREVHTDTGAFHTALTAMFRQDVDVVMIGEMRDYETISTAVTAAETGHLVFSTLHTNDATQTIDRIIDAFPPEQQNQISAQLAESLLGVFSQRLIPRVSGGMIPAYELLINNNAVANLIRERRSHEIPRVIETGAEFGMLDFNRSLAELVHDGEITQENAMLYSTNPKGLERFL